MRREVGYVVTAALPFDDSRHPPTRPAGAATTALSAQSRYTTTPLSRQAVNAPSVSGSRAAKRSRAARSFSFGAGDCSRSSCIRPQCASKAYWLACMVASSSSSLDACTQTASGTGGTHPPRQQGLKKLRTPALQEGEVVGLRNNGMTVPRVKTRWMHKCDWTRIMSSVAACQLLVRRRGRTHHVIFASLLSISSPAQLVAFASKAVFALVPAAAVMASTFFAGNQPGDVSVYLSADVVKQFEFVVRSNSKWLLNFGLW